MNHLTKADQGGALATQAPRPTETILKSDVKIPKLLLMQGLSDFVNEGKAKAGEMRRSMTCELLGDPQKPMEIIPLTFKNLWVLQEKIGKKYEFRGMEPRTAANEDAPWEFKKDGTDWKRTKTIDLYALLPQDVDAQMAEIEKFNKTGEIPDMNKTLLPVVIRFQSTGFKAGRDVVTHFTKAQGMAKYGVKAYGFTLKLACHQEKNDQGTFYVFDVGQGSKVKPTYMEHAQEWHGIVTTQAVQVDETDSTPDPDAVAAKKANQQRAKEEKQF